MSTIQASNVSDGTTTVGTSYVVNGSAKAWVSFNGTGTIAIQDSLNVSSLTDNGAGDYSMNFTSSFNSVYHACSGFAGDDGHFASYRNGTAYNAASYARIAITILSGGRVDLDLMTCIAHGDLA